MDSLQLFNGTGVFQASSSELFYPSSYDQVNQTYQQERTVIDPIDHSAPSNRLVQRVDGSLWVVPKTPAELAGEYLLRPMIDGVWYTLKRTFSVLHQGAVSIDRVIKPLFNFPPGAEAVIIGNESIEKEQCGKDYDREGLRFEEMKTITRYFDHLQFKAEKVRDFLIDFAREEEGILQEQQEAICPDSDNILTEDILINMEENFVKCCDIIDDLSSFLRKKGNDYGKLWMARRQFCQTYYNARWILDDILNDLKRGEESSYSPCTSSSVVMNSNFSLSLNGHLLHSDKQGFSDSCCSINSASESKEKLEKLLKTFIPAEEFSEQLQTTLPDTDPQKYEEMVERVEQFLNELKQVKTMLPSWLARRKLRGEKLVYFLEGLALSVKATLNHTHHSLNSFSAHEGWSQEQKLLSTIAKIQERQQQMIEQQTAYFASIECVVEKRRYVVESINPLPVSWRFVKKGLFGSETQLFSFTYDESKDQRGEKLKEEL